ncbi:hypothetical protein B484DRAFT_235996, partial [Ochromonadaceae sp. CCMP2298]
MSKRERMQEKETHASKTEEAMQRNSDWRSPQPLKMSIVVMDALTAQADSAEREAQTQRLSHTLEVRYLDDALIPPNPNQAPSATAPAPAPTPEEVIPWFAAGTQPEDFEDPVYPYADAVSVGGAVDAHLPAQALNLPPALRRLEPALLEAILRDGGLLKSILLPDGSVDEGRLGMLIEHVTVHGLGALAPPSSSAPQHMGGGMGGGGGGGMGGMGMGAVGGGVMNSGNGPGNGLDWNGRDLAPFPPPPMDFQAHAQALLGRGAGGAGGVEGGRRARSRWGSEQDHSPAGGGPGGPGGPGPFGFPGPGGGVDLYGPGGPYGPSVGGGNGPNDSRGPHGNWQARAPLPPDRRERSYSPSG